MEDGFLVASGNTVLRRVRGSSQLYALLQAALEAVGKGPRTVSKVIEELGRDYAPLLVTKAIERFVQAGLLDFEPPAGEEGGRRAPAVAGSHLVIVGRSSLATPMKALAAKWGCGSLHVIAPESNDPLAAGAVIERSMAELDKVTFCVAVAGSEIERLQLFPAVNRACLDCGLPWLSGHLDGDSLFVGPLFVPRETGCHACMEMREEAQDANVAETLALRSFVRLHVMGVDGETDPLAMNTLVNLVGREALRVLSRESFPTTYQTMVELSLVNYRTRHHTLLRVPACDVCGPFTTQPFRLAWDI